MLRREGLALRDYVDPSLTGRTLSDARHSAPLTDIAGQTCLKGRLSELSGRSVLLAPSNQFLAALVMLEVDGVAQRMLLCPPDLKPDHLQAIIDDAEIDAIVTDQPERFAASGIALVVIANEELAAAPLITGAIVVADVVLAEGSDASRGDEIKNRINRHYQCDSRKFVSKNPTPFYRAPRGGSWSRSPASVTTAGKKYHLAFDGALSRRAQVRVRDLPLDKLKA